ncbi:nuclear transport factor 2 family protein [Thermomonospora umbrina]|uniref:Actinorhodin biosynthesis protein ActVIA n=1 Tax=Thermomonospora umbrina TaxID=111806 RepID=A0A3D9SXE1_9ACTN|nr:nuclear transport factor 2 family protein [Thermomonospora umbrina]REE96271.1 actinorhodin biosynthesis protein ActVIA [Thermomonospora umbrina]
MTVTSVMPDVYSQVQHFYAHQMQALDDRRFAEYAATFTEDCLFQHSPTAEPARSPAEIVDVLVEFHERFADDPVQRRHWFNHVALEWRPDGGIGSTAYVLVVTTRPGGKPEIAPSCVIHDVLDLVDGRLRNRSRRVSHDQLPGDG